MTFKRLAYFILLSALAAAGAQAATQVAQTATPAPQLGWPREYSGEDYKLVVYQPQIRDWQDYRKLEASAAVMVTPPGQSEPVPGAVELKAKTDTHMDTRTVFIHDFELGEVRFPALEGTTEEQLKEIVRSTFPKEPVAVSLDRMLAMVERSEVRVREVELNDQPPKILVSTTPAILVNIDGETAWVPVGGKAEGLSFAANTNWDLFKYQSDKKKAKHKTYYLRLDKGWLGADDLAGPWGPAGKLPKPFKKLPMSPNYKDARVNVPGVAITAMPTVLVSGQPAELIVIEGEPKLVPIPDTPVLLVENTECDLFRHIDDGHYYYLVSGRWFRTEELDGEWKSAMGDLPAGFEKIPSDHAKAHVLASVPGTKEAEEAVLQAQIPQVAQVSRADAPKEVKVEYTGEPEFRQIEGTEMAYAVNTPSDVIRLGDTYYLCQNGVWFAGKAPRGPWTVADQVPKEIYDIPASSPMHHTTYVYVYDSTPSTVVYGYTSGYMGVYVGWGSVVWGTGYWYNPYYYYGPGWGYPVYYGYPYSYGAGSWYNPATGFYGRGYSYYGPYGGAGRGASYNPRTGTYARGGYAYGYGGGATWGQAFNPRTGTSAAGYRAADAYSSWGRGVVSRGDQWLKAGGYSDARGSVRGFRTSEGTGGIGVGRAGHNAGVVKGKDNVYVGRDGNVYRRGDSGDWSKHGKDGWKSVDRSGTGSAGSRLSQGQKDALSGLDRSATQRQRGSTTSNRYGNWRSSGGYSGGARGRSAGSISRAGGMRGGGRRR